MLFVFKNLFRVDFLMDKGKALFSVKKFLYGIGAEEKVAIVHHRDADGLCAGVVFSKAVEKARGKKADFVISAEYFEFDKVVADLRELKPGKIGIVDLSIDQDPAVIKEIESIAPVLLIDHHKLYNDCNSDRTVFIKAQMVSGLDGSKYPASKLCFDLFSEAFDLSEEAWIACVGLLGDMGYNSWKDFVDEVCERDGLKLGDLNYLKELISAVEIVDSEKFPLLFNEFYSKKPKEIENSPLNRCKKVLTEELTFWRNDFRKNAEFFEDLELYFYIFKPKLMLKSALIDSLTFEHPDKTLIIVLDAGVDTLRFSARRQDFKVKMNELLEAATKEIVGADAGGHIPAAAGSVPRDQLNAFKANVIKFLKELE